MHARLLLHKMMVGTFSGLTLEIPPSIRYTAHAHSFVRLWSIAFTISANIHPMLQMSTGVE